MKKILILVEGQTEERFVKDILSPFFTSQEIYLRSVIVGTKVVKDGTKYKGGLTSYTKAKRDLLNLLQDNSAIAVTTMFDFYGLPEDFPKWARGNGADCYAKIALAEKAFSEDINQKKFIPYLQLHEFEGLLFSSPDIISDTFDQTKKAELKKIRDSFKTPEEINQGEETHPSKRLLKLFPKYNKPVFGSLIAGRTGLNQIRAQCPHFGQWLAKLSRL